MHAVLGKSPLEFLARSEKCLHFWDKDGLFYLPTIDIGDIRLILLSGKWKGVALLSDHSLDTLEERLEDDEKDDFLRFLRRMLC